MDEKGFIQYESPMEFFKITVVIAALVWISGPCAFSKEAPSLRLNLVSEPHSIDPAYTRGSTGSYLLNNIFHGLYIYHSQKGLQPVGAKICKFQTSTKVVCQLNPQHKWSDGQPIKSQHYMNTFRRLLNPKTKTVQWELLAN